MKIVLLEDDMKLASLLQKSLQEIGISTEHAPSLSELRSLISRQQKIDLFILDRLVNGEDSKVLIEEIRQSRAQAPILILSAISTPNEKTDLINLGADDYMGKPFSTQELIARIRALLRRSHAPPAGYIQIGDLIIDNTKRIISVNGKNDFLPTKEFLLLHTLSQQKGRIWSRNDLLDYIWGQALNVETNVVEATIANIRKKLFDIGSKVSIKNARNVGYWIEE